MEQRQASLTRDAGFSLAELLVVIAFSGVIGAAIFWVYDVGQRTYTQSSSQEEAQQGARYGMDRLATELRLIGAYWVGAAGAGAAVTAATSTTITFIGDIDADTVANGVETVSASTALGTTVAVTGPASQVAAAFAVGEYLYIANGEAQEVGAIVGVSGTTITLATPLTNTYPAGSIVRSVEVVTDSFDPAARTLSRTVGGGGASPIVGNVTAVTLTYYNGANPPVETATVSQIREIAISVTTQGHDGSRRTMTSSVRPRNLKLS